MTSEVVWMKRLLTLLLALILLFSACAFAEMEDGGDDSNPVPVEADDGDDSNPQPVDMMEDEELEVQEEILQGRVLQFGDEGDDVLALQTRLKDLKYYTGNLSSRYREGTRKAVETFQADFELDQTGIADLRTFRQNAFQFFVKPVQDKEFRKDFERALRLWRNRHKQYVIKSGDKTYVIKYSDILYLEA